MALTNAQALRRRSWLRIALIGLAIPITLLGLLALDEPVTSLSYTATRATEIDAWAGLNLLQGIVVIAALSGVWLFVWRRAPLRALACMVVVFFSPTIAAACDTPHCFNSVTWALPQSASQWSLRIRGVSDPHDAEWIAAKALTAAHSPNSPHQATRVGERWIVGTSLPNSSRGPETVIIDARSGRARIEPVIAWPKRSTVQPNCPPDQLSCGQQAPLAASGQPFVNTEMGLSAPFPKGTKVCAARSGDAARGFYARYGASADAACDYGDNPYRSIGLSASWNGPDQRTVAQAIYGVCKPLSPEILARFGGPPAFPGHASLACQDRSSSGDVEVTVYALAGAPAEPGDPPRALYWAYLTTDEADLAEDVRAFQRFLQTARIGFPAS